MVPDPSGIHFCWNKIFHSDIDINVRVEYLIPANVMNTGSIRAWNWCWLRSRVSHGDRVEILTLAKYGSQGGDILNEMNQKQSLAKPIGMIPDPCGVHFCWNKIFHSDIDINVRVEYLIPANVINTGSIPA